MLLKVFTEWCYPCKLSAPKVQELWEDYQDDGLVVLAVDQGSANLGPPTLGSVQQWVNKYSKTHPVLADPTKIVPFAKSFFYQANGLIPENDRSVEVNGRLNLE